MMIPEIREVGFMAFFGHRVPLSSADLRFSTFLHKRFESR